MATTSLAARHLCVVPSAPVRVVVADDSAVLRSGLTDLLEDAGCFRVVAQAADGFSVGELCIDFSADLALVDVQMPHGGPECIADIRESSPTTAIIAYTAMTSRGLHAALEAEGADAVLTKGDNAMLVPEILKILANRRV